MYASAIALAQENSYSLVKTDIEENNRAMLSIDERLGFRRLPDWISFGKNCD